MKPRVFVAIHYLELGGAETSIIGLLHALDYSKVDVDLFVYSHHGDLMKYVPAAVNVLPENKIWATFESPLKELLMKGYFRMFYARMMAKLRMKVFAYKKRPKDGSAIHGYLGDEVVKVVPDINPSIMYDLAVSYMNPHDFWLKHVRARKKICWIHTDYSQIDINTELELPVWSGYDNIISISADVTKSFLGKFPLLRDKIIELDNILPKKLILSRSEEKIEDSDVNWRKFFNMTKARVDNGTKILLSVGRICKAKNYDNIPYMAYYLKRLGLLFHWFVIGPGDNTGIVSKTEEIGVDDVVTFLGPCSNPYPYIKLCDIYVHPSRYEGKSIVVREAQMLCKPVIITNYPTAHCQVKNGLDGIICDLDNRKIAEAIYILANDAEKQKQIICYLQTQDYAGVEEIEKIMRLLN